MKFVGILVLVAAMSGLAYVEASPVIQQHQTGIPIVGADIQANTYLVGGDRDCNFYPYRGHKRYHSSRNYRGRWDSWGYKDRFYGYDGPRYKHRYDDCSPRYSRYNRYPRRSFGIELNFDGFRFGYNRGIRRHSCP